MNCSWCQFIPAQQGDIYCAGCRSAVARQTEYGNFEPDYYPAEWEE